MDAAALDTLWKQYVRRRTLKRRNQLAEYYWPWAQLTAYHAAQKLGRDGSWDTEDADSWAGQGLLTAIPRFDPAQGYKFETFALQRIRGAVLDGVRELDPAPRLMRQRQKRGLVTIPTQFALQTLHGRDADGQPVAYDAAERRTAYSEMDVAAWWAEVLKGCSLVDRQLMQLLYCEHLTMRQVGERLGITESGISLRHSNILRRIRPRLAGQPWLRAEASKLR